MIKTLLMVFGITALVAVGSNVIHARFSNVNFESIKGPVVVELFTSQS